MTATEAAPEVQAHALTAAGLFDALAPFGPAVEGGALVFDHDPPEELLPALRVLHTGLRALLTGAQWWGSAADTAKRPRVAVLDLHEPLPAWVGLLCVAGDTRWDRIHPAVRLDLPDLFAVKANVA